MRPAPPHRPSVANQSNQSNNHLNQSQELKIREDYAFTSFIKNCSILFDINNIQCNVTPNFNKLSN
jgi:hypothetical protein